MRAGTAPRRGGTGLRRATRSSARPPVARAQRRRRRQSRDPDRSLTPKTPRIHGLSSPRCQTGCRIQTLRPLDLIAGAGRRPGDGGHFLVQSSSPRPLRCVADHPFRSPGLTSDLPINPAFPGEIAQKIHRGSAALERRVTKFRSRSSAGEAFFRNSKKSYAVPAEVLARRRSHHPVSTSPDAARPTCARCGESLNASDYCAWCRIDFDRARMWEEMGLDPGLDEPENAPAAPPALPPARARDLRGPDHG